jgi:hypothetical protein
LKRESKGSLRGSGSDLHHSISELGFRISDFVEPTFKVGDCNSNGSASDRIQLTTPVMPIVCGRWRSRSIPVTRRY